MGVINLWTELVKYDNVFRTWSGSGATPDTRGIVAELSGKVLAIDTSVWIFQCSQQSDLKEAIFDENARVLYTFFNRILNLLRYGATPVFVLEGDTPEAKRGRLSQRSLAKGLGGCVAGNRRGGRHDSLGRKVVELLDLMGIPHVDAPGEAEALCAALVAAGLAGGAVTSDVDALLFGAPTVYREFRLSMDQPRLNVLERADAAEAARRCFGLRGGGGCAQALRAVACLCGCDYSVSGGKGVGVKTALEAVQQLTAGQQDDACVLPELLRFLGSGPDPRVTALKACTGCKNCGHEKHGRQPCQQCGPGPCRPKGEGAPCACEFHRSEPQRKFMRVIARAVGTSPCFADTCRAALDAFESETQRARAAAQELHRRVGAFSWSRRPDVRGVFSLLHPLLGHTSSDPDRLLWTYGEVRDKMRPALMEWDMRQGPEPPAPVRGLVEFRPRRIKQVASKDGEDWAYLVEFERLPDVNTPDAAFDSSQLSNSKMGKARHVRQALIAAAWPHLLALREEEEQAKLNKPKKGRSGKAAAGAASQSPGGASGPASVATASGGHRGRSRARPAATVLSDATAGSRDVMMRFLHMGSALATGSSGAAAGTGAGAAAPTASVQQQSLLPRPHGPHVHGFNPYLSEDVKAAAADRSATGAAAAACRVASAAAAGAAAGGGEGLLEEDEDDVDGMDFHMTQRNDAPPPPQQQERERRRQQPPLGAGAGRRRVSEIFPAAAAAFCGGHTGPGPSGAVGARVWQPLWSEDGSEGGERSSGGDGAAAAAAAAAADTAGQAFGARNLRHTVDDGRVDDAEPMSLNQRLGASRRQPHGSLRSGSGGEGRGGAAAGQGGSGGAAAAAAEAGGDGDVEVFDLTQLADTPAPAPRRRSGGAGRGVEGSGQRLAFDGADAAGETGGLLGSPSEEQLGEEDELEGDDAGVGIDDAVGSAVKTRPPRSRAAAGAGGGARAQPQGASEPAGGQTAAAAAGATAAEPGSRRARLLRTLFPDREPPSPLLGTPQVRKKVREDAGPAAQGEEEAAAAGVAGGAAAGPSGSLGSAADRSQLEAARQPLQPLQPAAERRPDPGLEGSPPKRRNKGDGGASGVGNGEGAAVGRCAARGPAADDVGCARRKAAAPAAAAAAAAGGAARSVAAEPVDLTLSDSDDDGGGDGGRGGGGGGGGVLGQVSSQGPSAGQRGAGPGPRPAIFGPGSQPAGNAALAEANGNEDDDVVDLT